VVVWPRRDAERVICGFNVPSPAAERRVAEERRPPLIVDLDGTLLRSDLLDETFAAAFFRNPILALLVVVRALLAGRARLKEALCRLARIDVEALPLRASLVAYLDEQKRLGRELHLATAADQSLAQAVADRLGLFERVYASDGARNLKGRVKAEVLAAEFPGGFSYAGDCRTDLAVWRVAASAVVIAPRRLADEAARVTELEHHIQDERPGPKAWLAAARPHQWTKNLLVLVPTALGWPQATPEGLLRTVTALVLLCLMSSLTYVINDVADVQSDRRHASKHRRPFAAGALKLREGLIAGALGIPTVLAAAWLLASPGTAACLLAYTVVTLSYSMGLKRAPLLDCMIIGILFTLRIATGVTAGGLVWSPWLLTFSLTLFFSLAMAKRDTELVAGGPGAQGQVRGRGFRYEDRNIVLAFGVAASTLSILIVVLYLVEEVFPAGAYRLPVALWAAPPLLFLWIGRIWLLANRGEMHDDPVVFALKDRISHLLGAAMALAFLIALL
jgi:4-hydroxybenzoate polyprenyltransferase/phosphoserine phosphatase